MGLNREYQYKNLVIDKNIKIYSGFSPLNSQYANDYFIVDSISFLLQSDLVENSIDYTLEN